MSGHSATPGGTLGQDSTLAYVIIYVADVERSAKFYESAFGLKIRRQHPKWTELETGQTTLAITPLVQRETNITGGVQKTSPDEPRQNVEVSFSTSDVHAMYKKALAAGAQGLAEPEQKPWNRIEAYVRDLDGIGIRIGTHMPPEFPGTQ